MTKNQLDYWANKEKERNNRIVAAENMSHNEQMERNDAVKAQGTYLRGLASQSAAGLDREKWANGGKELLAAQVANFLASAAGTEAETTETKGSNKYRRGYATEGLQKSEEGRQFLEGMGDTELGADWATSFVRAIADAIGLGDLLDGAGDAVNAAKKYANQKTRNERNYGAGYPQDSWSPQYGSNSPDKMRNIPLW